MSSERQKLSLTFLLNRGAPSIDYVGIFPGPNFVSPEWRCPLNRSVPKERFHCILALQPRDKAAKLECNTVFFFPKEFV